MFGIELKNLKNSLVHRKFCKVKIGPFGKNLKKHFYDFFAIKKKKNVKTHFKKKI
jgi:hypothetical protein